MERTKTEVRLTTVLWRHYVVLEAWTEKIKRSRGKLRLKHQPRGSVPCYGAWTSFLSQTTGRLSRIFSR